MFDLAEADADVATVIKRLWSTLIILLLIGI